jgi:hypothetical protein
MSSIKINGLGSVKSDRVYAPKKGTSSFNLIRDGLTIGFGANQSSQAFRDSVTGISYEVEFNKRYIAFTYKLATNANASVTGRFVWEGNFAYKGDAIISANVASVGLLVTSNNLVAGSPTRTAGAIYKPVNGRIKDPFQSLPQLISKSTSLGSYQSDGIPGVSAGDITPFLSYGGGKFFNNGWEANPFKPNLI